MAPGDTPTTPDAVFAPFQGQDFGEHGDAGLGDAVMRGSQARHHIVDGGIVDDDTTGALLLHHEGCGFGAHEGAAQVHAQDAVPFAHRHVQSRVHVLDPGVVDQDVEATESLLGA